jgi:hypothetical protein
MPDVKERLVAAGSAMRPPEDPFDRLLKRRDRRGRNQRVAAGAVAGLMALAVLGGGLFALSHLGPEKARKVASGPESDPTLVVGPGQYFYLDATRYLGEDGAKVWETTWWATDSSGTVESRTNRPDKYSPLDSGTYSPDEFPVGEKDYSELSTDPDVLAEQLRERSSSDGASPQPDVTPGGGLPLETGQLWRAVRFLLDQPNVVPQLRAALFQVASGVNGVKTVEHAVDPGGRPAVALELTSEEIAWTLYFDPASRQLMATHSVYDSGEAYNVFDSAIVDSNGAEPTADQWLFPPAERLPSPPATLVDEAA